MPLCRAIEKPLTPGRRMIRAPTGLFPRAGLHSVEQCMQQNDLNRAVARATGETVATVKRLGFLLADPQDAFVLEHPHDERLGPQVIDWDELEPRPAVA
jgi:hypothetical protein